MTVRENWSLRESGIQSTTGPDNAKQNYSERNPNVINVHGLYLKCGQPTIGAQPKKGVSLPERLSVCLSVSSVLPVLS